MKDTWFFWLVLLTKLTIFDQVLNRTSNQEGQFLKMIHQDAHGLIKLAILIWLASLLVMPIKLPTYLLT
jgi:hypothetical protein